MPCAHHNVRREARDEHDLTVATYVCEDCGHRRKEIENDKVAERLEAETADLLAQVE